jgi:hypothetical protein
MQIHIPIPGEDRHGIQQTQKRNRRGRLDGDADPVLGARGPAMEALEEEEEDGAEERGLDESVEEDLGVVSDPGCCSLLRKKMK